MYVASAKAKRKIAHGSVGATGDFGFRDLYDSRSLALSRRMISEPLVRA